MWDDFPGINSEYGGKIAAGTTKVLFLFTFRVTATDRIKGVDGKSIVADFFVSSEGEPNGNKWKAVEGSPQSILPRKWTKKQ